jgi:hypothetical protein
MGTTWTADRALVPLATDKKYDGLRNLTVVELGWVIAIPAAVLTVAALWALGSPLGRWLFPPSSIRFWLSPQRLFPEPTEHARYLIAAAAPLLASGILVLLSHQRPRHRPALGVLVRAAQLLTAAFAVFAVFAQHSLAYRGFFHVYPRRMYFTTPTLVVGALLAVVIVVLPRLPPARARGALRETPARRAAALLVAALFVAAWLLTAINSDATIGRAASEMSENVPFWLDETFSLLNGSAPLVSFHAQYAQLWPYAAAGLMALLGTTLSVFTATMAAATAAAMLAVYATLRRVVRSSLVALALFLPFLATSFFKEDGPWDNRYAPSNLLSLFPMRYGGPYLLAWLLARHLDRARPRRALPLFLAAGLVTINNVEFGAPAFAATFAALVWTAPRPLRGQVGRLVAAAALGMAGAVAAVALLTLIVAGSLPHFGLLLEFSRIYGLGGFGMLPMPAFGLHLALYVTFAAAIVVATTRALSQEDRLLTGLLCWAGVFGLGVGGYYAGRSHPDVLIDVFSAWAFALCLLLVVAVRNVARRPSRRPTIAELAVFAGFGIAACSVAQTPAPWSQVARLQRTTAPVMRYEAAVRLVRQTTRPGERIGILGPLGHRIAYEAGVKDVVPYSHIETMVTVEQWDEALRAMASAHARSLFIYEPMVIRRTARYLLRAGWTPRTVSRVSKFMRLVRSAAPTGG